MSWKSSAPPARRQKSGGCELAASRAELADTWERLSQAQQEARRQEAALRQELEGKDVLLTQKEEALEERQQRVMQLERTLASVNEKLEEATDKPLGSGI